MSSVAKQDVTISSSLDPQRYADWVQTFGHRLGKKVVLLTGETSVDLRLLRDVSQFYKLQ